MGKRTITRRRGSGTNRYRANSHRYFAEAKHVKDISKNNYAGKVVNLVHSVSHSAPLAVVEYEDGSTNHIIAAEGMRVGDVVLSGSGEVKTGNTIQLQHIPEGTLIYNIEGKLGDGGRYIRASGTFGKVIAKSGDSVIVLMPSGAEKSFSMKCRAAIGSVAGGGRLEKPFVKAGKRWHAMRATGKLYPITSPVAMNALNHPFGSGRGRHPGKSTVPPRWAPPGRNVGQIRAKRTGRKK